MARRTTTDVLLEDIKAHNRATYEGVMGAVEGLERRIGDRFERLEQRLTLLENTVRAMTELRNMRAELSKLRSEFDNRSELSMLEDLERRVALLEKRRPQ